MNGGPNLPGPRTCDGFIPTTNYQNVIDRMEDPNVHGIVITGRPGSGKSTLAEQACEKLYENVDFIFRLFNCSSIDTLYQEIGLFYRLLGVDRPLNGALTERCTWSIVESVYRDISNRYPDRSVVFMFDDVYKPSELLRSINNICLTIQRRRVATPNAEFLLRKILVTSQRGVENPTSFGYIKEDNVIAIDGFDEADTIKLAKSIEIEVDADMIRQIRDALGPLPLAQRIFMKTLKRDPTEEISEFIQKQYLPYIQEDPALICIKACVERVASQSSKRTYTVKLIKVISFLNEKNISEDLLTACAEAVTDEPKLAKVIADELVESLQDRDICSTRKEDGMTFIRLHQLVKQAMRLLVQETEELDLLQTCLIALTRVIPTDGRHHQARFAAYYVDHGECLDSEIKDMLNKVNSKDTPFVLFLHGKLLIGIAYCMLAQCNGFNSGVEKLEQARDKFYELIFHTADYSTWLSNRQHSVEGVELYKDIAGELYRQSTDSNLHGSADYQDYIKELSKYHIVTEKDLRYMALSNHAHPLVNNHLTAEYLLDFRKHNKLVNGKDLPKVHLAEVLARLYCVWAKIHDRKPEDIPQNQESYMQLTAAAMKMYDLIYDDFKVYLLSAVITRREMLDIQLKSAVTLDDTQRIVDALKGLVNIGNEQGKQMAFEDGLMKSFLPDDDYHKMACKQKSLKCQGRRYVLYTDTADKARCFGEGKTLLKEIEKLAERQPTKESAFSFTYRLYADFLYICEKYGDAVRYSIQAMKHLHQSMKSTEYKFPELHSRRFEELYTGAARDYTKYSAIKGADEKLLEEGSELADYLSKAMEEWKDVGSGNEISDANVKYQILENIVAYEIPRPQTPVAATT